MTDFNDFPGDLFSLSFDVDLKFSAILLVHNENLMSNQNRYNEVNE